MIKCNNCEKLCKFIPCHMVSRWLLSKTGKKMQPLAYYSACLCMCEYYQHSTFTYHKTVFLYRIRSTDLYFTSKCHSMLDEIHCPRAAL